MDNKDKQTIGIDEESRSGFTTIATDDSKNETSISQQPQSDVDKKDENGSKWDIPGNLMKAVKDDFPTSAFVLILIGYVIIETFGNSGINFKEYILLILLLFLLTGFLKLFRKENVLGDIIGFLNNKKFLLIAILILLINTILNQWDIVASVYSKITIFCLSL